MSSYTLEPYFSPAITLCLTRKKRAKISIPWIERVIFILLGCLLYAVTSHRVLEWRHLSTEARSRLPPSSWNTHAVGQRQPQSPMPSARVDSSVKTTTLPRDPAQTERLLATSPPQEPPLPPGDPPLRLRMEALMSLASFHATKLYNQETKWIYEGI